MYRLSKPAANSLAILLLAVTQPAVPSLAAETGDSAPSAADSLDATVGMKESYRQRIAELQAGSDRSDPALGEAWLGLGSTLQFLGEDTEAMAAFGEALQSLRIANGLHDASQLPVLQRQLVSQEKLQDWQAVDATVHLMHYITTRQYPPGAAPRFDALRALTLWKQRAAHEKLLGENLDPAAEAATLSSNEIRQLKALPANTGTNLQLAALYLDLATMEFMQARTKWAQPLAAYGLIGSPTAPQMQCQPVRLADGRTSTLCSVQEVPNLNYYQGPNSSKNLDVAGHLVAMEQSVLEAYNLLRNEPGSSPERKALQDRMDQLASDYNHFINEASPRTGTQLRP